jgi:hypothetical protein
MTKEEREKAINKIMGYLATYLSVEQYAEAEKIIKELRQDTVSRESYEHEYFLRKEFDFKIAKLERTIEELQKQSCEDCVSREAVVEFLRNHAKDFEDARIRMAFKTASSLVENANNIPPITPTQRWVPVSERLPRQNEYVGNVAKHYLIQDEFGDIQVAAYKNRGWIPIHTIEALEYDVIAWMPLPASYQGESEGKHD